MFEPFRLAVLIDGMFVVPQNIQSILVGRSRRIHVLPVIARPVKAYCIVILRSVTCTVKLKI